MMKVSFLLFSLFERKTIFVYTFKIENNALGTPVLRNKRSYTFDFNGCCLSQRDSYAIRNVFNFLYKNIS